MNRRQGFATFRICDVVGPLHALQTIYHFQKPEPFTHIFPGFSVILDVPIQLNMIDQTIRILGTICNRMDFHVPKDCLFSTDYFL